MSETNAQSRSAARITAGVLGVLVLVCVVLLGLWSLGPGHFRQRAYWQTFMFGRLFMLTLGMILLTAILHARAGGKFFIRRIPGLTAIDETVGRATEMGRPISFSLGLNGVDVLTLQALAVALHVVRLAIRFGTRVIITMRDAQLYAVTDEAVSEAYAAAGRPESFNRSDIRFLSNQQFAYAAGMVGVITREQVASNYMFGQFYAESLIMAEAANQIGAIQVAGTPSTTQIPFFIAACDYTIIGDEYYAATAYLTREPVLSGSLVGLDRTKLLFLGVIIIGTALATVGAAMGSDAVGQLVTTLVGLFRNAK